MNQKIKSPQRRAGRFKMDNSENTLQENTNPECKNLKRKSCRHRKLRFIIPVLVLAVILTSVFGIVYAKKKFRDGPDGFLMGMVVEKLDLNSDQKAQVEKLRTEIREKMEAKKDNRESMMNEFANEFKKDNMDRNKLKELDQKREQNMQEMKDFMMDKMIEFHNILTPDQRVKAIDAMKELKDKFHDRMERPKDRRE
jgi:Spy/CpxP family protein refolding chaperone